MLDTYLSQQQFGDIVGVNQQAISDLVTRDVLRTGETGATWLLAYTAHLREQAAGRGSDGKLADTRARLATAQAERVERQNGIEADLYAHTALIEQVLSATGRKIAQVLEGLPVNIARMCPALTAEAITLMRAEISKTCDIAVRAALDVLREPLDAADVADHDVVAQDLGSADESLPGANP